ncbi:hypothetical protein GNIT_1931 [Glaciecola nitratireducens FR1064]|uniref:Uncharacterized protein n=1 Tax=Glaciecola nitratireducens (strain JCM 12485 / KCTC 12276 / FR1064) TaxID=1085623 RepID=G4QKH4_GLANF|nr:hypothetical protein GNIT_1931 [Glaciecola nitratireducens FR1064]
MKANSIYLSQALNRGDYENFSSGEAGSRLQRQGASKT